MSTPDDLITWGHQQLDDDERVARASATHGPHWKVENGRIELDGDPQGLDVFEYTIVFDEGSPDGDQLDHIARHDPARILAEVDAKRRILDLHQYPQKQRMAWGEIWACSECGDVDNNPTEWPCETVKLLALPFADREGYREEWRP